MQQPLIDGARELLVKKSPGLLSGNPGLKKVGRALFADPEIAEPGVDRLLFVEDITTVDQHVVAHVGA